MNKGITRGRKGKVREHKEEGEKEERREQNNRASEASGNNSSELNLMEERPEKCKYPHYFSPPSFPVSSSAFPSSPYSFFPFHYFYFFDIPSCLTRLLYC